METGHGEDTDDAGGLRAPGTLVWALEMIKETHYVYNDDDGVFLPRRKIKTKNKRKHRRKRLDFELDFCLR